MSFDDRLKQAIERGQKRGETRAHEAQKQAMTEEECKRLHSQLRLRLSEQIEACIKRLPNVFPGFQYETITTATKGGAGPAFGTTSGSPVASGFLVMGPYDLTAYDNGTADMRAAAREEELEGLVATVAQTFLGLTVNCSRCHDHKFDPITQQEFYQFSAALGGTYHGAERESLSSSGKPAAQERIAALRAEMATLTEQKTEGSAKPARAAQRSRLESMVRLLEGGPAHVSNPRQPGFWRILARGDFRQPGLAVSPRGIASVSGATPDWKLAEDSPEGDRRKALAQWIASRENPLTARVIVNRLWGHHFGAGLVRTPSDFGFQGGMPSHPELLDWLAGQLVQPADGPAWSLKRIQRLIVLSSAYRQSSPSNPKASGLDAENRLVLATTTHAAGNLSR